MDFYIFVVFLFALLFFVSTFQFGQSLFKELGSLEWIGIAVCAVLVVFTEWFSIDLYYGKTSLSTSAVPILAGVLLYGPIGALLLSLTYSITLGIKYHNHLNRYVFNFSNQLIASTAYTLLVYLIGIPFLEMPNYSQLFIAVVSALIVYISTTGFIAFGMSLDLQQPFITIWRIVDKGNHN